MARIVNNRICYPDHNVVLDILLHRQDPSYIFDMEEALTEKAGPTAHEEELEAMNNDSSWTIELPTVTIVPYKDPARMLATVELFDGNKQKVIFAAHCARSESFQPLWEAMRKQKIFFGSFVRKDAETKYFALYDALV
jgi:hypothetical protein